MPNYMTQSMSSPHTITITYYCKQSSEHVSHVESGSFTRAAKRNYAQFNHIDESVVSEGTYRSNQGVPIGGKTYEITHRHLNN